MALLSRAAFLKRLAPIDAWACTERLFQTQIGRPLTWRRRALVTVGAVGLMIAMRASVEPIIGADVSFTIFFPVVIITTLAAGALGGLATVVGGSVVAIAFSTHLPWDGVTDAAPRLVVWLISALFAAMASLALRHTMVTLQHREADLLQTTEQLHIVVGELERRGKNALAIVEALSHEAAQSSASVEDYKLALSSKIQALGSGYAFLTRRKPTPFLLGSLVSETLHFFEGRIEMAGGPLVWLAPDVCVAFALALHELATNAAKHGSLSTAKGRVVVSWSVVDSRRLCFVWAERNGPVPTTPIRQGFGSRMIQKAFQQIPGGVVTSEMYPNGIVCRLDLDYGVKGPSRPVDDDGSGADPPFRLLMEERL